MCGVSLEIGFGGGARLVHGRRVAGVGVVVWGLANYDGLRAIIARATIAIPSQHHVAYAEAFGCRTALLWVADRGGHDCVVRIARDNLVVLRYCAHVGRLRRPGLQSLLDGALGERVRAWVER